MKVLLAIVLVLAVYAVMIEAQGPNPQDNQCQDRFGRPALGTVCSWGSCPYPAPAGFYCGDGSNCCLISTQNNNY